MLSVICTMYLPDYRVLSSVSGIETIGSCRIILLSGFQKRRMEVLYIDSIRLHLCFQTERISLCINMSVFAFFLFNEVTGIKLYARAVRSNIHGNATLVTVCSCDQTAVAFRIIVCYIVMVISACKFKLFEICVNILSDFL